MYFRRLHCSCTRYIELDEEGIAIVKDAQGDPEKIIEEAARSCPTLAIIIEDDNGNQIYPEPTSKPSNPGAASAKGIQSAPPASSAGGVA